MHISTLYNSHIFDITVNGIRYMFMLDDSEEINGKKPIDMDLEDARKIVNDYIKLQNTKPMSTQAPDHLQLWNTMTINDPTYVQNIAKAIGLNKQRYEEVSETAAEAIPNGSYCPWYVIGLIHLMECSLSFTKHLHNGDPLSARTVHVPVGRPKKGSPPFTWHQSATDAIRMLDFNNAEFRTKWEYIPFVLQKLEEYNGLGYRNKGIYSPYLWAGTNHYTKGKYVADGKWDPNAISKQTGVAPILSRLLAM